MSKTTTAGIQSVERRLHTRHRARTTVYITTPHGRKKLCRAINLSATGVFVETTNLGLRKGQQVELAFAINLGAITGIRLSPFSLEGETPDQSPVPDEKKQ